MSRTTQAPDQKIGVLTGVRFIAASLVFFYHSAWRGFCAPFKYGWCGVGFFFALSGLLFMVLYHDLFVRLDTGRVVRFYLLRFARIYPSYLLVLTAAVLVEHYRKPVGLALHLLMLHQFWGAHQQSILIPLWTLSVEMSFYLLVPIILFATSNARSVASKAAAFAGLCVLSFVVGWALSDRQWLHSSFMEAWGYMTIFGQLPNFAVGMLAGYVYLAHGADMRSRPQLARAAWLAGLAVYALTIYRIAPILETRAGSLNSDALTSYLFATAAALFFLGSITDGVFGAVLGSGFMIELGDASYLLYLVHHVGGYIKSMTRPQVVVFFIACNIGCILLHRCFESPVQEILRARIGDWFASRARRRGVAGAVGTA